MSHWVRVDAVREASLDHLGLVGRVRHLYVLRTHRRAGVGERLLRAIVDAARGRFDVLRLRTSNPAAARLYERLGFQAVDETDCTHTLAPGAVAA